MHIDFHLYGTYLAARFAGFERGEAEQIAFAAQCVDDLCFGEYSSVKGICTTGVADFLGNNDIVQRTWTLFHFLPSAQKNYWDQFNGEIVDAQAFSTAPNSYLSNQMTKALVDVFQDRNIDRTVEGMASPQQKLAMAGVVMHVLADTYAHEGFSGISAQRNIVKNLQIFDEKGCLISTSPSHIPAMAAEKIWSFNLDLGHGTAGHLPDISWAKYSYLRESVDNPIVRDNSEVFIEAFKKMVIVLLETRNQGLPAKYEEVFTVLKVELEEDAKKKIEAFTRDSKVLSEENDDFFARFLDKNSFLGSEEISSEKLKTRYSDYLGVLKNARIEEIGEKYGRLSRIKKFFFPEPPEMDLWNESIKNDFFFATLWHRSNIISNILIHS